MFQKKDKLLVAFIVIAAGIAALVSNLFGNKAGSYVRVTIDGELYGEYSLQEDQSIEIQGTSGYNRFVIIHNSVKMLEADCPDQYCVKHAAITNTNETIVCLPHKLTVEIVGDAADNQVDIDALTQ